MNRERLRRLLVVDHPRYAELIPRMPKRGEKKVCWIGRRTAPFSDSAAKMRSASSGVLTYRETDMLLGCW